MEETTFIGFVIYLHWLVFFVFDHPGATSRCCYCEFPFSYVFISNHYLCFQTFYYKCQLDEHRLNNHTDPHAANVSLHCEEPKGYLPDSFLLSWWRIVYWMSQLLTWLILPIMQSYSNAGDFTFSGKLKSSLYNNAIYYGIYACLFIFLLFYALSKGVSLNL